MEAGTNTSDSRSSSPPLGAGAASSRRDDCPESRAALRSFDAFPAPSPRVRAFFKSFVFAYFGILQVVATQRNMVVHCIIAIPTLLATQLLSFTRTENIIVLLCVALVLACELINTSIENLCDVVSPNYNPAVRRSKDAAAGMVLISAIASAAVGVILFTSEGRFARLLSWNVAWQWGGSIDNVMVKLILLGHCWLLVHAWIYRLGAQNQMRES